MWREGGGGRKRVDVGGKRRREGGGRKEEGWKEVEWRAYRTEMFVEFTLILLAFVEPRHGSGIC